MPSSTPQQFKIVDIKKPWNELEVVHIDHLVRECGMFTSDTELNNGYGCKATQNTVTPGCCYEISCPIATILDEEDPRWEDTLSPGKWLIVHSKFVPADED